MSPLIREARRRSLLLRLRTDERLLGRAQAGDAAAATALVERYGRRLQALAATVAGPEVASSEVASALVCEVASVLEGEVDGRHALAEDWLYRVTRDHSLARLRGVRTTKAGSPESRGSEEAGGSPQKAQRVRENFDALPESQRTALLLRLGCSLPYERIAWVMRTDVAEVKSSLVQARCRLALVEQVRSFAQLLQPWGSPAARWSRRKNRWLVL